MKRYTKSIYTALVCFLIVTVLNFLLPRLLPGDPIAYLTGFGEEEITAAQYEKYYTALNLDKPPLRQFLLYIVSLVDGTLGYSFKKDASCASLIMGRLGVTLQITLPAVVLSTVIGLVWGLHCGYKKGSLGDKLSTGSLIVVSAVPTFVTGLCLVAAFCFKNQLFPYTGINSDSVSPGTEAYFFDRVYHLVLPVLTLTVATVPSRFLLMRNTARKAADEKYVLYARERGLSDAVIKYRYLLPNIVQPFITMVGMSVSICVGGSLVIENIFSVPGMGKLLSEAVYTLDYPLMQGILFVTTLIMALAVILTDILCILVDPKLRLGGAK